MKKTHKEDRISLVREFPDRAIRWLLETLDNLRGLLLTINKDIAERIDYSNIERIERTFIEDDFRKREADILFKAKFLDDTGESLREFIIYVLIEHQSSVDPIMPFRILYYMTQIWESQRREWESQKVPSKDWRFRSILPVVFYTGKEKWNSSLEMKDLMEIPSLLKDFAPLFFLVEFIRHRRKQIEQPKLFNIIISNIEDINRREEVRNMSKTGALALIEEGMEKGMELGLIKAKQEDLINLLSIRFSTIPRELTKKIKSIRKIDKLDTLFVHAIKADELSEIEIELKN